MRGLEAALLPEPGMAGTGGRWPAVCGREYSVSYKVPSKNIFKNNIIFNDVKTKVSIYCIMYKIFVFRWLKTLRLQ